VLRSIAVLTGVLLVSCAAPLDPLSNFLVTATAPLASSPAPLLTATDTPMLTPTRPTPTFTPTPTLIGAKTGTFTQTVTQTAATQADSTATGTPRLIPTAEMEGFNLITLSASEFYVGECEPSEVKFTAQVSEPAQVAHVDLFVRFKSITTGVTGPWTSISMDDLGAGTFTHTLVPEEMKALSSYENPWVQYQLVATSRAIREVGRTQIFDELLRLKSCDLLTPSPTAVP